jgi:hypothetical protein
MAIVFGSASPNAEETISEFLNGFVEGGLLDKMPAAARFDPDDVSITDGLPMYYLDGDELDSGQPLATATAGGWRYLLISGGAAINDVCLDTGADGQLQVVSSSVDTPMTQSTVTALQIAEADERIRAKDYQARQLYYVDEFYFVALWLHGTDDDLIIPLAPSSVSESKSEPIELHEIYAASDILAWLKTKADSAD